MDLLVMGCVTGVANALLAVGLVLTFKSNRVINLAHGEFGAFAVAVLIALVRNGHWSYWPAFAAAIAGAALLALIAERTIVQRLYDSPRLTLLVATLGLAQLVIVLRLLIPKPSNHGAVALFAGGNLVPVPFSGHGIAFGRVVLLPQHVYALVVGPLVAIAVWAFLRYTAYGVALRASAENGARARLLGIPVRRVSTLAWVIAAVLSAVAAIILAPVVGYSSTEAVGLPLLTRGLAAATAASFGSVGIAFWVGLGIGVLDYVTFFGTGQSGLTDVIVFGVVLVSLLVRRRTVGRADAASTSSWEFATLIRPLPPAITSHPHWKALTRGTGTVTAVAVLVAPFVLTNSVTFFLGTVLLVACVGVSLTMLTGWGGHLSVGQWALAGGGAVLGSMLVTVLHLPFWWGFTGSLMAGGLMALLLGLPALRLEGVALAVVTLSFAVAGADYLFDLPILHGSTRLVRPAYLGNRWYYGIGLAALVLTVAAARGIQHSRVGRNIVAVRDNEAQAAAYGVPLVRTKLTAFVVAGVVAGGAGFLWAAGIGDASGAVFDPVRSLSLVAVVVIGGLGSIAGGVIGAFYLLAIPYFGGAISPYIGLLATGIGLLALVLALPGGLAQVVFRSRDVLARWVTGLDPRPQVEPVGVVPFGADKSLRSASMSVPVGVGSEEGAA